MTIFGTVETEMLAAGTDLMERRRTGVARGPVTRLQTTAESTRIHWQPDGSAIIVASVTIAAIAADQRIRDGYPGLAAAAQGLATPQIRNMATTGGNLAQKNRCWYFRNPHHDCLKKGGSDCPARNGNHLYGIIFDTGPCVAPHPSTLGVALLAYDAKVSTTERIDVPAAEIFGDGSDGKRDNTLKSGEIISSMTLPPPVAGERAAYDRVISRAFAEWPLVEAVVRIVRDGPVVRHAYLAVGGVAPVPLRLKQVEQALEGAPFDAAAIATASRRASEGARPLPQTVYKVAQLKALVSDLLARLQ